MAGVRQIIGGRLIGLAVALALAAAPEVSAQQPAQGGQTAQEPGPRRGVETITVTARKVEQDLQATAEAVTAFSGNDLETQGIDEVKSIGRISPNVRFENVPGTGVTATVTIRGVSQADLLITGDPSVGIYVDGIYNARLVGGNFSFFDVERVEVLKGPQGTLYGKNTPAGAVNIWSRRPSPEFGGFLRGTYGSEDRTDTEGAISFPILGEELSGRLAFLSRNDDGYITNHAAAPLGGFAGTSSAVSGGVADQNGKGARLSLLWDPSEQVEVWAQAYRYRERRKGGYPHQVAWVTSDPALITSPVISAGAFDNAAWAAYNAAADDDDIFTTFRGRQDIDTAGSSFTASYDLGPAEVKYLGGFRKYQFLNATDLDGSPLSLADVGRPENPSNEKSRQSSHELTLIGTTLEERLSYTGGLYFFTERSSNATTSFFDTAFGGTGFRTFGDLVSRIQSWAAYLQGTYSLTDRLGLTLGFRHTEERREMTRQTRSCTGIPCTPFQAFPGSIPRTRFSDRWDAPTWLASLEFQATDEMFLYAKASRGYRSGGWNGRGTTLAALAIPFDEEFVTSYEVGVKRDWLDSLLRTNLALFFQKYKDRQTTELRPTQTGIASVIVNSGSADVSGGELEVWAEPLEALRLGGSVGWNWFRFNDSSAHPANNPALTYYLWGDYRFPPFDFGQLSARLEFQYQSRNFSSSVDPCIDVDPGPGVDVRCGPRVVTPNFGLVNGRVGLDLPTYNTEVALLVTNLLDREYFAAGVDFIPSGFGFQTRYYGAGRRFAIELTYRFGADAQ